MAYLFIEIPCKGEVRETLMAHLLTLGAEAFEELDEHLKAFFPETEYDVRAVEILLSDMEIHFQARPQLLPDVNWNEEWEKHFEPVIIEDRLLIRASFHQPNPALPLEIVIDPQMSFGTGHHPTTALMSTFLLDFPPTGRSVLDVGSGTGILAILAEKLGASTIDAFDIDPWSFENMAQNAKLNDSAVHFQRGTIDTLTFSAKQFDVVLANINRNILLEELVEYEKVMAPNGVLYLSGFYIADIEAIVQAARKYGLEKIGQKDINDWVALKLARRN
jgi:ribosomal protein L11 methyltransferase